MYPGILSSNIVKVLVVDEYGNPLSFSAGGGGAGSVTVAPTTLTRVSSTLYENSRVLKAAPGQLVQLRGYTQRTSAQWLMLFDAAVVPANGATNWVNIQAIPGPGNFSFDVPYEVYVAGIVICNSTTDTSLTLGSADCWFTADVL